MNTIAAFLLQIPVRMVPGQGFIVVGNKTQKNTICIFIEKQNRMSDTRGEMIRHNMQKNACIFVKHVKN